jgi:hypothetical protein
VWRDVLGDIAFEDHVQGQRKPTRIFFSSLGTNSLSKQTVHKPDLMHKQQTKNQAKDADRSAYVPIETLKVVCRISNRYGDDRGD